MLGIRLSKEGAQARNENREGQQEIIRAIIEENKRCIVEE